MSAASEDGRARGGPEASKGGTTAADRLRRLLHVLPAASRHGGAPLGQLADSLGASPGRILEDLREVTDRSFYHPGGWPDDIQILLDADRVRVFHAEGLDRPLRLTRAETLALAVALRGSPDRPDAEGRLLLQRAESHLGRTPEADLPMATPDRTPDPAGIRDRVFASARSRRPCRVRYARPGPDGMSERVVHPYAIAYARGAWYVVGRCSSAEAVRIFRIDRIVEAELQEGAFDVPEGFDVRHYVQDGSVYHASRDVPVRVRYSPSVARWIRERMALRTTRWWDTDDGGVTVEYRVSDPHWIVRETLQYGPDAEILEPEDVRALARDAVEALAG